MVDIKLIEQLRQAHGYTQAQIATMMGYNSDAAYNRKIKKQRSFTVEDIVTLCRIFQLELADLILM